jgi:hypothetical protein
MIIWSDFDINSENSQKMIEAKQVNGPEYWPTMREVFKYDCETLPFPRFRLWASVHNVPLVTQYKTSKFYTAAFNAAFNDPIIAEALKENWIGIPADSAGALRATDDYDTSVQRIQDVAHLVLCGFTPEILKGYKSIIEIGAGYGDMCSVVHKMGFEGKYTIVDIPEVAPIQDYYLRRQGIEANFKFESPEIENADLVISTWALSETPLEYRERLMPTLIDSKNWLIMYQAKIFGKEVNEEYFTEMFKDRNPEYSILNETPWDGKNTYMVIK